MDISDPLNPTLVDSLQLGTGGAAAQIFVSGNYAYLAAAGNGLLVIDISNPAAPNLMGTFSNGNRFGDVFVAGNHAYVLDQSFNKMRVVDISNAANPTEVAEIDIVGLKSIYVQGNYAYIAAAPIPTAGMHIVDISNPQNPTKVSFFETAEVNGQNKTFHLARKVAVDGSYAYIGTRSDSWLFIVDVSNPANPVETGKVELTSTWGTVVSLQIEYPSAYLAMNFEVDGFREIDISNRAAPAEANQYESPYDVFWVQSASDYLYVASLAKLWIYGMSDPTQPAFVNSYNQWGEMLRIFLNDTTLFGLNSVDMRILDVTDAYNVSQLSSYQPAGGQPVEVFVLGSYAYLLTEGNPGKLEIVDISDLANPVKAGDANLLGIGRDLLVTAGSTVAYIAYYASGADKGFQIVDVSDPAAATLLGSAQTVGVPISIWVEGDSLFVGSNTGEDPNTLWHLEVFDISDPSSPTKVTEISDAGEIWDLEMRNGSIFAGIAGGSVYVLAWDVDAAGTLSILAICHSDDTRQISTTPNGSASTGYVATTEGFGEDNSNGEKDISGDDGVVIQTFKFPKAKQFVAPKPMNIEGDFNPGHSCITVPSGFVACSCGSIIPIAAIDKAPFCESYGWNFYEWTGCASGNNKNTQVQCEGNGQCEAIAVWHMPVLGLSTVPSTRNLCASEVNDEYDALDFNLCASELDDWKVSSLTFQASGDGRDHEEIKTVRLYWESTLLGEQTYPADDGSITFQFGEITIQKNDCESFLLTYEFDKEKLDCPICEFPNLDDCDESKDFSVTVTSAQVVASPVSYANGKVIGDATSGPIKVGCIRNITKDLFYKTIQDAVDDANTDDIIEVCAGTYTENVDIHKALTLRSTKGYKETTIQALLSTDHVLHLKSDKITIEGFTIKKASLAAAGIFIGGSTIKNGTIANNFITGNMVGVHIRDGARSNFIGESLEGNAANLISGNSEGGILIEGVGSDSNMVAGNFIGTKIGGKEKLPNANGVIISDQAKYNFIGVGEFDWKKNIISGNELSGVRIDGVGTDKNKVLGNYIGTDIAGAAAVANKDGIRISGGAQADTVGGTKVSERNVISGNSEYGILIDGTGTSGHQIRGNFIGLKSNGAEALKNGVDGIWLSADGGSNVIGGSKLNVRNIISAHPKAGIRIDGSHKNKILGNFIGTTESGKEKLPNKWGVYIQEQAKGSLIGGTGTWEDNLISGNLESGVHIEGAGTDSTLVAGNYIGMSHAGARLGNKFGIYITDQAKFTSVGNKNTISGNDSSGILIEGAGTDQNKVWGNLIGLNFSGKSSMGNRIGILIRRGATRNIIGGNLDEERNIISGNSHNGICLEGEGTDKNMVWGNYIGTDKEGQIDLGNFTGITVHARAKANVIGLSANSTSKGNLISGNVWGIDIANAGTDSTRVAGNLIGTMKDGETALPNYKGILITEGAKYTIIGGVRE